MQPADWLNVDPDPRWSAPLRSLEPIGDGTADGAVAHHVLQMIPWPELVPWLAEVRRVLRPGGYLRLSVPDLTMVCQWLGEGSPVEPLPPIADDHETSVDGKVCLWLSQAGATRSVFTAPWLVELCHRAGFVTAGEAGWCAMNWSDVEPRNRSAGPDWLTALDLDPDRRSESVYVDAVA